MAELAHGRFVTLDKAQALGILSSAEALVRPNKNEPWEAVMPGDEPVEQDNDHEAVEKEPMSEPAKDVSLHRALHKMNKGGLHRALGVKEDEPIPQDQLEAAMNSDNPHIKHMAMFAHTLKGFKHGS